MPIPERHNPTFAPARPAPPIRIDPLDEARKRLIVALDVPDAASANALLLGSMVNANGSRSGLSCSSPPDPRS